MLFDHLWPMGCLLCRAEISFNDIKRSWGHVATSDCIKDYCPVSCSLALFMVVGGETSTRSGLQECLTRLTGGWSVGGLSAPRFTISRCHAGKDILF